MGVITSHEFWAVWMMDCLRTFGVSFGLNVQELGEIFLGKIDEVYGVDIFLPHVQILSFDSREVFLWIPKTISLFGS